jgi:hypothetical protein
MSTAVFLPECSLIHKQKNGRKIWRKCVELVDFLDFLSWDGKPTFSGLTVRGGV